MTEGNFEALLKVDSCGSARLAAADERINRVLADAVERHATKDPCRERHTEEDQCRLSSRAPQENCTGHRAVARISRAWWLTRAGIKRNNET